jgi:hypothetical protein
VVDEDAHDTFEVTVVQDQQPVEAFGADGSDEPLGDGVCLRRPHRGPDDPDAAAARHLIEGGAVLAVAVADQQVSALVGEIEAEIARLLGDPRAGWVG